ncbi:L-threonine 3-dehydrogenase [Wenzhouxiangella marina]|uniref:L-threonine 3-dehydrogenase n=2 Tax=Wenzhouxiangella marina TaxID=1579979 RepID=A0A0K0XVS3_9GAMM|nr:L-threonine 3-dehydrogenase [Wenzhouxiangella marina]AKS41716.1 L-threonine 3-dehydrogenase [Wenzhouxiangella marina]MBB6086522.1 threonine 3-dehydrogenase [Wenzhouxiangella marina]
MTAKMRALVKASAAPGIEMRDVPIPRPGSNEVLVKLEKTAICGTDLHIYQWDDWAQRTIKPPLVIGHEFVGRIVDIGEGVRGYEEGQRVSAEGHVVCGVCRNCRAGKPHLCPHTEGIGVNRDGGFAEYVVVPASNLWPIPDAIPSELAAFFDPFGNAAHCALQFDLVGEDVLITGAGPIGIIAAGIARHVGARHVVISDVNDYRLQLAADMGATRTINVAREKLTDVLDELDIDGFDIGMEMSGNPQAFNDLLTCMYHGGKVALLGILPKGTGIDWDKVIFKGLEMHGIYGRRMYETWYKTTQMVLTGFPLHKAMTHQISIDDFEQGFELMAHGECGKIVCDWTGDIDAAA